MIFLFNIVILECKIKIIMFKISDFYDGVYWVDAHQCGHIITSAQFKEGAE